MTATSAIDLVNLRPLLEMTEGLATVSIGLIDGPVQMDHPSLRHLRSRLNKLSTATCVTKSGYSCQHGTYIAGILFSERTSETPGLCPGCTPVFHQLFAETNSNERALPSASPQQLADAIHQCLDRGVAVINISAASFANRGEDDSNLEHALSRAASEGTLVVVAAGNQGSVGSTTITRHPWPIPVVAFNSAGLPLGYSNIGLSIGQRGLGAPGDAIRGLDSRGGTLTSGGTSAAAPFVTAIIALLWSVFPGLSPLQLRAAIGCMPRAFGRVGIVPPLVNASVAYARAQSLSK